MGETACDGKKMFELLNDIKTTYVMHLPQNNIDPKAYPFWADEVKKLKERIEEFYNITITEDDLRQAIKDYNQERRLSKVEGIYEYTIM